MSGDDWLSRFTEQEPEDDATPRSRRKPAPVAEPTAIDRAGLFEGTDATGLVRVFVDDSAAVRDVVVPANWRDSLGPAQLGAALVEAGNKAIIAKVSHDVENSTPAEASPVTRPDAQDADGDPSSPVARDTAREILGLLGRFGDDLATYTSQLKQTMAAPADGAGVNGAIVISTSTGQFASATVDPEWARYARPTEVRAEALTAFEDADRQAAAVKASMAPPPASITRIRELASDPQALLKQLGLLR